MLEFSIFGILVTCVAGMISIARNKREDLPVWERKTAKGEIEAWLNGFLAKLKRNSTRTQKCRLILSVERMTFEKDVYAAWWEYVQFGENELEIFCKFKISRQKLKLTKFQKIILEFNLNLKNVMISRSEIKEETGEWEIEDELKNKLLSSGGEALVFSQLFGNFETAVRLQIFEPFLFTNFFGFDTLTWKIHLEKG